MARECREVREAILVAAGWLAGFWLLARLPGPAPSADPAVTPGTAAHAHVSVIIPARNEAATIGRLLASLRHQTVAPREIIVVDDHSTDATAAVASSGDARVVTADPLPDGWTGKSWACHHGSVAAGSVILIFLDADVILAPDALARLVAEWQRTGGLVSVEPCHVVERPYERLSAVANIVSLMGTGAFTPRRASRRAPGGQPYPPAAALADNSARVLATPAVPNRAFLGPKPAMAFGPCMIMQQDEYNRAGGHAHPEVRGRVAEDIALAQRFAATAQPVRILAGRDSVAFRMYPNGAAQLVEGWTRSLAAGARRAPRGPAIGVALWVSAALLAAAAPFRALRADQTRATGRRVPTDTQAHAYQLLGRPSARRRRGDQRAARAGGRRAGAALATYGAFSLQVWWMLRRIGRFGVATSLAFPLPLSAFVVLYARSELKVLLQRPATWKGRPVLDG
jgi:4,4'-diaponeurosporenoate glycosyltransferase